jgi:hypothetical protein
MPTPRPAWLSKIDEGGLIDIKGVRAESARQLSEHTELNGDPCSVLATLGELPQADCPSRFVKVIGRTLEELRGANSAMRMN